METKEQLAGLQLNSDAAECLMNMDKLLHYAGSERDGKGKTAVALLVVAPEGAGLTSFSKVYSGIVDDVAAYARSSKEITFLELDFPKNNEGEEKLFFASPGRLAANRNHFLGTMVISLREFEGWDLIRSESFDQLLRFVNSNKEYIHFVIHVLPEFKATAALLARLRTILNVAEVRLLVPDQEEAYTYVIREITKRKVHFGKNAECMLKNEVLPKVLEAQNYRGYTTLERLVDQIVYELILHQEEWTMTEPLLKKIITEINSEDMKADLRIGFIR